MAEDDLELELELPEAYEEEELDYGEEDDYPAEQASTKRDEAQGRENDRPSVSAADDNSNAAEAHGRRAAIYDEQERLTDGSKHQARRPTSRHRQQDRAGGHGGDRQGAPPGYSPWPGDAAHGPGSRPGMMPMPLGAPHGLHPNMAPMLGFGPNPAAQQQAFLMQQQHMLLAQQQRALAMQMMGMGSNLGLPGMGMPGQAGLPGAAFAPPAGGPPAPLTGVMGAPPQPPQQPRQERGPRSAAAEPAGSDDWRSGRGRAPHAAPARRSPPQKRPMPEPADREGPAAVEKEAPLSPEELERQKKRRLEEIAAARAKQEAENKRLAEERRKRVEAAKLAASSRPKESLSLAEQVELLKRKIREQEEKVKALKAGEAPASEPVAEQGADAPAPERPPDAAPIDVAEGVDAARGTESPLIATESGDPAGGHEGAADASVA